MSSHPAVSVVMPVKDGADFIGEALRSIGAQTFEDLEVVVVDDGSSDGTRAIVRRAAAVDPRIRLIEQDHRGLAGALNTGLEAARAPWIARLDADDHALPGRLARQLEVAARRPDVAVWAGWALTMDASGRVIGQVTTGPVTDEEFRSAHAAGLVEILHPTVLARRETLLEVGGYDERLMIGEDVELWDRVGEVAPILTLPEPLIRFRVHPDSESTRRIAESLAVHRFVAARRTARGGGHDLDWESFVRAEAEDPLLARVRRRIADRGAVEYRRAGVAYATARPLRTVRHLTSAVVLRPGYVFPRLWRQVIRPRLRRGAGTGW